MAQEDYSKVQIRIPEQLHRSIKESAAKAGHSMNTEIIERLDGAISRASVHEELVTVSKLIGRYKAEISALRDLDRQQTEIVYSILSEIAKVLSKSGKTAEDERDLMAKIIQAMTKIGMPDVLNPDNGRDGRA